MKILLTQDFNKTLRSNVRGRCCNLPSTEHG